MVILENAKVSECGTLVVKDKEIERFAYAQLKEYNPSYFDTPHPLDIEDFTQFYLNQTVRYWNLAPGKNGEQILGTTATSNGKIKTIDEDGEVQERFLNKGDIVIDQKTCKDERRERFTLAHEAWHAKHSLNVDVSLLNSTISNVGAYAMPHMKTLSQWDEYHANLYADYLLMPAPFMEQLFCKYHAKSSARHLRLVASKPKRTWYFIGQIADELNVSVTAMAYRLKGLGLISERIFRSLEIKGYKGGGKSPRKK